MPAPTYKVVTHGERYLFENELNTLAAKGYIVADSDVSREHFTALLVNWNYAPPAIGGSTDPAPAALNNAATVPGQSQEQIDAALLWNNPTTLPQRAPLAEGEDQSSQKYVGGPITPDTKGASLDDAPPPKEAGEPDNLPDAPYVPPTPEDQPRDGEGNPTAAEGESPS